MKLKLIALLTLIALPIYAAEISPSTTLPLNTPWIDVLKQIDNNDTVAAALATRLGVVGSSVVLGTGVGDFLATPTSANLATAVTNETGSTLLVFNTSPTIVTPTVSGVATVGPLKATTDTRSGAGAVSVTTWVTKLTSTGSAEAITLADGVDGQFKTIVHDVDGGSMVLTPATKTGFTTITFTAVGESATLVFVTTRGWIIVALNGAVAA